MKYIYFNIKKLETNIQYLSDIYTKLFIQIFGQYRATERKFNIHNFLLNKDQTIDKILLTINVIQQLYGFNNIFKLG